ncbi:MAG: T9SS type A sorting domain-containing protein [Bacteroidota bacterium]
MRTIILIVLIGWLPGAIGQSLLPEKTRSSCADPNDTGLLIGKTIYSHFDPVDSSYRPTTIYNHSYQNIGGILRPVESLHSNYAWGDSSFYTNYRTSYHYDAQGRRVETIEFQSNGSHSNGWNKSFGIEYTFDDYALDKSVSIVEHLSYFGQDQVTFKETDSLENGKVVFNSIERYAPQIDSIFPERRYRYLYDQDGKTTMRTMDIYDGMNFRWYQFEELFYEYLSNPDSLLFKTTGFTLDPRDNSYYESSHTYYSYNQALQLTSEVFESGCDTHFTFFYRYDYAYDVCGNMAQRNFSRWDDSVKIWNLRETENWVYDPQGALQEYTFHKYDGESPNEIIYSGTKWEFFTRDQLTSIIDPVSFENSYWTNPVSHFETLHIDDQAGRRFEFSLYDYSGRKVLGAQGNKMALSSIEPGIYLLTILESGINVYSQPLVVE